MLLKVKQGDARWTLFVLVLIGLLGWTTSFLPGMGVQRRLDVSQGLKSEVFLVSVRKAGAELSSSQIEALEWALNTVDGAELVKHFGRFPTVRQIVLGEVLRSVDERRKKIAMLETKLAGMKEQIERNENERRKALMRLQAFAPVITAVGYPKETGFPILKKEGCCSTFNTVPGDAGEHIFVWYRMGDVEANALKSLPCRITYSDKTKMREYEEAFNCLGREKAPNDEYFVRLKLHGVDASNVKVNIEVGYEDAQLPNSSKYWSGTYAVPALLPELAALKRAKREMKLALDYKSLM